MRNDVLWIVLALTLGFGTAQSINSGSEFRDPYEEPPHNCYRNGTWYNPCPPGEPPLDPFDIVPETD